MTFREKLVSEVAAMAVADQYDWIFHGWLETRYYHFVQVGWPHTVCHAPRLTARPNSGAVFTVFVLIVGRDAVSRDERIEAQGGDNVELWKRSAISR